jgi:predicted permease
VPLWGDIEVDAATAVALALVGTGALLILLIACTNVSALLVSAGVARRREIAIRLSLGASRLRVVRQLVTESLLIALAGGALGLMFYWSIVRLLAWQFGDAGIGPDLGTVGFTAFIALGTGIVFGLSPALHATRLDVSNAVKDAGGGATSRSRLQRAFIVAQIGLTQPLLVGLAMVIGITMSEFGSVPVDDPLADRVTRIELGAGGESNGSPNAKHARIRDVMDRVARLPGVERVIPDASGFDVANFRVHAADRGDGPRAEEVVRTQLEGAAPGYFAFQNIPMLRGRDLVAADTTSRDMAIVIDNGLARGFWGPVDPIGKRLEVTSQRFTKAITAVVVGVFDTTRVPTRGASRVFTANGARWRKDTFLVRTQGPGTAIVPTVRQLVRAAIPDIPIYRIATLEQIARQERHDVMMVGASASGGGLLALLLASIGLYGVVALAVTQRHREIGIRVALGARPRQVIAMFFASGVRLSLVGLGLGLPFSVAALYALASSFVDTVPINMLLVAAGIAVVVIGVASLATWIPARRAAGVDPLIAMRVE